LKSEHIFALSLLTTFLRFYRESTDQIARCINGKGKKNHATPRGALPSPSPNTPLNVDLQDACNYAKIRTTILTTREKAQKGIVNRRMLNYR